ncbi:hypothetical protein PF007_g15471 [Phytophthora fragariae]|uniref:Uncharacterized protein n=1 Tax=Phytophthora fragariae TaxID=53985 RepID=A0A6A3RPH2_9STRA|nr:hypothetical protein PF007_g15471 [Phytophthora fragariae]KAE9143922.1 hypothetical protein PF006_g11096 [Phytophthora fragariae]
MDVVTEHSFLAPVPTMTNKRERLRCRHRGYEKRLRGCKTKSLNMQADPRNEADRHAQEALQALRPPDSEPPRVAAAQYAAADAAGGARSRRRPGRHEVAPGLGAHHAHPRLRGQWRAAHCERVVAQRRQDHRPPVAFVMSVDNYSCIV